MRHLAAALLALSLSGCAHLAADSEAPSDAASLVSVAVCASQSPLVARSLLDGRAALAELEAALRGALERLAAGEPLTDHQVAALREVADAVADVRACL